MSGGGRFFAASLRLRWAYWRKPTWRQEKHLLTVGAADLYLGVFFGIGDLPLAMRTGRFQVHCYGHESLLGHNRLGTDGADFKNGGRGPCIAPAVLGHAVGGVWRVFCPEPDLHEELIGPQ